LTLLISVQQFIAIDQGPIYRLGPLGDTLVSEWFWAVCDR